jgi:geranylgeranyl reductase family protein
MFNTDVLVVGGGPAGSFLASRLAQKGIDTTIIDRQQFPRPKTCGGGITSSVVQLLPPDLPYHIKESCRTFQSSFQGLNPFLYKQDVPIVHIVQREEFDNYMLERARSLGVTIREGVRVKKINVNPDGIVAETDQGTCRARYVVGAGGVGGVVARSTHLRGRKFIGSAIMCQLAPQDEGEYAQFHETLTMDFGMIPYGYGWVFPAGNFLNVGVFTQKGNLKGMHRFLERYLAMRFPWRPAWSFADLETHSHLLPLGGRFEPLHMGRSIIVGDCAGLVDPLSGEGISYGIRSGQIGAMVVAEALSLENPSLLSEYTLLVQREIVSHFRYSWLISQTFFRFPKIVYSIVTQPRIVNGYKLSRDKYSQMGEVQYSKIVKEFFRSGFFSVKPRP